MKSTGIVRPVDKLGRVVIPIELRKTLGIRENDELEIFVEGSNIILKKQEHTCVFCGGLDNIKEFKGKNICQNCIRDITEF